MQALADRLPLVATDALRFVGRGLARPECVLACASGRLYVSDRRGGVTAIDPDGEQRLIGSSTLVPNGIALCRDGSFLVSNLGADGGLWRIDGDGTVTPWLLEVEGERLPRVNFVTADPDGRVFACVSALHTGDDYPVDDRTGFILVVDEAGARIVADGLQYTNECRLDPSGRWLYVNETFGRRVTRFAVTAQGALHDREAYAEFGRGDFPDGLALDAEGGVWIVCVGSNRVYRVAPDRTVETILDDSVGAIVAELEAAFEARRLTRPLLSAARGTTLRNISSIAFGGPDLRTAYLGCLGGDALASFRAPVAGVRPVHWTWS